MQFRTAASKDELENGTDFMPRFDDKGLIATIVADASSGEVLMFAFMNAKALALTIKTGEAHFWSRSRNSLWRKGETSGNLLRIVEMRTDCDQDVLLLRVEASGDGVACHTGQKSCFYRRIEREAASQGSMRLSFPDRD